MSQPKNPLPLTGEHHLFGFGDGLGRVQTLRAGVGAVHDGVAAVKPEGIFQIVQPLTRRLIPAVSQEAV